MMTNSKKQRQLLREADKKSGESWGGGSREESEQHTDYSPRIQTGVHHMCVGVSDRHALILQKPEVWRKVSLCRTQIKLMDW